MDTELESADKVDSGEENSPAAPAGIRIRNLSITSPALYPTSCPSCSSKPIWLACTLDLLCSICVLLLLTLVPLVNWCFVVV